MASNGLLIGLTLLERTEPCLKSNKRDQLSRLNLEEIKRNLSKSLEYISDAGINDILINGYLISVVECIDIVLSNSSFVETDSETKNIIVEKTGEALNNLYVAVGKYYTTHDFDYSVRLDAILQRVINECIARGYYFGVQEA